MLTGISIVCFAASYGVATILELTRFFFRARVRTAVMVGFAAAGLFAHSVYLVSEIQERMEAGLPWISWYTGCLVIAWMLAATYLLIVLFSRQSTMGLVLLPTAIALIAAAHLFPKSSQAVHVWSLVHGFSLMFGIAMVVAGFIAGLMYLIQSDRWKHKLPPRSSFWLPSLEKRQKLTERAL